PVCVGICGAASLKNSSFTRGCPVRLGRLFNYFLLWKPPDAGTCAIARRAGALGGKRYLLLGHGSLYAHRRSVSAGSGGCRFGKVDAVRSDAVSRLRLPHGRPALTRRRNQLCKTKPFHLFIYESRAYSLQRFRSRSSSGTFGEWRGF